MSEVSQKEKAILSEKRLEQLALARIKAAETKKKNAALREQKRVELAKQQLFAEQGGTTPLESVAPVIPAAKDPAAKAAKWNQRKQEIVEEVHERIKGLGLVNRFDPPKARKKNFKKRTKSPSPITSEEESESDLDTDQSEEETQRPAKKSKIPVKKKPVKQHSEPLLRLY